MRHPYIESFLIYRNYRLQAAAARARQAFFSGPTLGGLTVGVAIGFFSNYSTSARVAIAAGSTLLGFFIDSTCRLNSIAFLKEYGSELNNNFRECMMGKKPDECKFTDAEILQMAQEVLEANKEKGLPLTPQEVFLLPTKVLAKMRELETLAQTPAHLALR